MKSLMANLALQKLWESATQITIILERKIMSRINYFWTQLHQQSFKTLATAFNQLKTTKNMISLERG